MKNRSSRAESFNQVPELYHRYRPGYPPEIFLELQKRTGLKAGSEILEIGAGSGQATGNLLIAGYKVTALEPAAGLRAILEDQLRSDPQLKVHHSTFEEFSSTTQFAAVFAAQSFHWPDPETKYQKVCELLRDKGWLVLVWNLQYRFDEPLRGELDRAYSKFMPPRQQPFNTRNDTPEQVLKNFQREVDSSELFFSSTTVSLPNSMKLTTAGYLGFLSTHSDHRELSEEQRNNLLKAIEEILDKRDSEIEIYYLTGMILAQKR